MQRRLQALSTLSNARVVDDATTEPVDMIWLFSGADLTAALGSISKGTLVIAEVSAFKSADESAWFIKECHGRKGMLWPVSPCGTEQRYSRYPKIWQRKPSLQYWR